MGRRPFIFHDKENAATLSSYLITRKKATGNDKFGSHSQRCRHYVPHNGTSVYYILSFTLSTPIKSGRPAAVVRTSGPGSLTLIARCLARIGPDGAAAAAGAVPLWSRAGVGGSRTTGQRAGQLRSDSTRVCRLTSGAVTTGRWARWRRPGRGRRTLNCH